MGLQKYRFDFDRPVDKHGVIETCANWLGGPSLAGLRNCPTEGYGRRTVYIQGPPDTYFSIPAAIVVKRKTVKGWVSCSDDEGWMFHPQKES